MLTSRGLGRVLGDLAAMGFDAKWGVLGANDIGANHQRDRIWIVAKWRGQLPHAQHDRIRWWEQQQESIKKENRKLAHSCNKGLQRHRNSRIDDQTIKQTRIPWFGVDGGSSDWWQTEPNVGRVADGVAARVDRLKAIGNGQVPLCAATAWRILK